MTTPTPEDRPLGPEETPLGRVELNIAALDLVLARLNGDPCERAHNDGRPTCLTSLPLAHPEDMCDGCAAYALVGQARERLLRWGVRLQAQS